LDAADPSLVRQQTLQTITSANFREDVNTSGRIDAAHVFIVPRMAGACERSRPGSRHGRVVPKRAPVWKNFWPRGIQPSVEIRMYNYLIHMSDDRQLGIESLGLAPTEAQVYLALLRNGGTLRASALAVATGLARPNVYPILSSLADKGIVESEAGYGSPFRAVRPKQALSALIGRQKQEVLERERRAAAVIDQLESLVESSPNNGEAEVIQVLRDPRVCTERFERLQLEAKQEIDVFVKYPILNPRHSNPSEEKALNKGVRNRALYERAIVDAPEIKPYLSKWIAFGEEARVYDGELPHKLAIFDRQNILMPLVMGNGQTRVLFIRHPQLAASLTMLFEFLWERAKPITASRPKRAAGPEGVPAKSDKQATYKITTHR
jgi:sugar-specific transcriptional regulator TrmB